MSATSAAISLSILLCFCAPVLARSEAVSGLPTGQSLASPIAGPSTAALSKTSPLTGSPDWAELSKLDRVMSFAEFTQYWTNVYADDLKLPPPWSAKMDGLEVATSNRDQPTRTIVFRSLKEPAERVERFWRRPEELPPLAGRSPLADLRICLDPGHIGGGYAVMEERHLSFNPNDPNEYVREGDSTLLVAQALKPLLEAAGATVSMTREKTAPVTEANPDSMRSEAVSTLAELGLVGAPQTYAGLQGTQKQLTVQWQAEKLFYRVSEIRARAAKVNEKLKPDIVICLHLNAEGWGDAAAPQYSLVNHFHILINGCYAAPELQLADVRFEALRRIFHRTHDIELPLAEAVAGSMSAVTQLPPYVYTTPNARRVGASPYVYARNLLANRLFDCPVIYLEPYVMNHRETYGRLVRGRYLGRTLANGRLQTSIIEDYARGVAQGVIEYYRRARK